MTVSANADLNGAGDLAVGNALGSNLTNVGWPSGVVLIALNAGYYVLPYRPASQ